MKGTCTWNYNRFFRSVLGRVMSLLHVISLWLCILYLFVISAVGKKNNFNVFSYEKTSFKFCESFRIFPAVFIEEFWSIVAAFQGMHVSQTHWLTSGRTDAGQWSLCAAMLGRWHKNTQTDGGTDRRRTKWSLCAALLAGDTKISYLKYMERRVESLNWFHNGYLFH